MSWSWFKNVDEGARMSVLKNVDEDDLYKGTSNKPNTMRERRLILDQFRTSSTRVISRR